MSPKVKVEELPLEHAPGRPFGFERCVAERRRFRWSRQVHIPQVTRTKVCKDLWKKYASALRGRGVERDAPENGPCGDHRQQGVTLPNAVSTD